ncbi:UNVERIFIED_CONTAM: hypothetical protein HDU68_009512 [Siphonaria sp. JEL0065]|nr:hypothetical protein HDU68_009512 [Siphonaria sp. JEL0065]
MANILVIGSGLAGAFTALVLKESGHNPTLYDQVNIVDKMQHADGDASVVFFGDVGGSIAIYNNGLRVLERYGLIEEVYAAAHSSTPHMNFMKMDGSDPIRYTRKAENGLPMVQVLRTTLHNIMMRAAQKAGVRCFTGKRICNVQEHDDSVTATFSDGTSATGDFLFAADGIHSFTRHMLFPDAKAPVFYARGYVGIFDRKEVDGEKIEFQHPLGLYSDGLVGCAMYASHIGEERGGWTLVLLQDKPAGETDNKDWVPVTVADLPREATKLATVVESWGSHKSVVNTVKYATRITPVTVWDLPDLASFYKGRVLLVGDAAHGTIPTLGQGLGQGLEDAGVLGQLLGEFDLKTEYKTIFELYEKVRLPHTRAAAKGARDIGGRLKAHNKVQAFVGRHIMRGIMWYRNTYGHFDAFVEYDYRLDVLQAVAEYKKQRSASV